MHKNIYVCMYVCMYIYALELNYFNISSSDNEAPQTENFKHDWEKLGIIP